MKVSVISDYAECLKMVNEVKLAAGKLKQCQQLNYAKGRGFARETITRKKCCRNARTYDAEEYYKTQIQELSYKIRKESAYQNDHSIGICFVVFRDGDTAKRMLDVKWVQKQIREKISIQEARSMGMERILISKAYLQNDIVWTNLKKSVYIGTVKRIFLFVSLLLLSLTWLNPIKAVDTFMPVKDQMKEWFSEEDKIVRLISDYFKPCVYMTINFCIIPCIIDTSVYFEDYRRKSSQQISIMRRTYLFMLINTFLVPITQIDDPWLLITTMSRQEPLQWNQVFGNSLMTQ